MQDTLKVRTELGFTVKSRVSLFPPGHVLWWLYCKIFHA